MGMILLKGEPVPDYESFYNLQSVELIRWMYLESNRTKMAKLYRTACRMEYRFRKYNYIPERGVWKRGDVGTFPVEMWIFNPANSYPNTIYNIKNRI